MGIGGSFPGLKRQGCVADQLPLFSTEIKNAWSYTSTLPSSSWRGVQLSSGWVLAWYLVKHRDFTDVAWPQNSDTETSRLRW